MSDSEIDEEYFYSDDGQEFNEVDEDEETFHVDNLFSEGEDLVKENPRRAVILFENILCLESEQKRFKWSARSLAHLMNIFREINHVAKIVATFEELCCLAAATVSNEMFASACAFLDSLDDSNEQELVLRLCTLAINGIQNVLKTHSSFRLWFSAKLRIATIYLSAQKFTKVESLLVELKSFCTSTNGGLSDNRSGYLMEVYCLELLLCNSINDRYRSRSVYSETLKLKAAFVPAKVMAIIHEEGGKLLMSEFDWKGAFNEFRLAFQYHKDRNFPRTEALLQFTVLAGSFADIANPLVYLDVKSVSDKVSVLWKLSTELKSNFYSRCERGLFLAKNPLLHSAWRMSTMNSANTAAPRNQWLVLPAFFDCLDAVDFYSLMVSCASSDLAFVQRKYVQKMMSVNLEVEETVMATYLWCKATGKALNFSESSFRWKIDSLLKFYGKHHRYVIDYRKLDSMEIDSPIEQVNMFVAKLVSALDNCRVRRLDGSPLFQISKYVLVPLIMEWIDPEDFWVFYRSGGRSEIAWMKSVMNEFPSLFGDYALRYINVLELVGLVNCLNSTKWIITESMMKKRLSISRRSGTLRIPDYELINRFAMLRLDSSILRNPEIITILSMGYLRHLEMILPVSNPKQLVPVLSQLETFSIECDRSFLSSIIVHCRNLRALTLKSSNIGRLYFLMSFHCVALQSITIYDHLIRDKELNYFLLYKGSQLKLLCLYNAGALTNDIATRIIASAPNLTSLSFHRSPLIMAQAIAMLLNHLPLRSFTIGHIQHCFHKVFWSALVQSDLYVLCITELLWTLDNTEIIRCVHLQSLTLRSCKLSDAALLTLLTHQEGFGPKYVDISGNDLSSDTLCTAAQYLRGVKDLLISGNRVNAAVLKTISFHCFRLQVLDLHSCPSADLNSIDFVLRSGHLRSLHLDIAGCSLSDFVDFVIDAPSLRKLNVSIVEKWGPVDVKFEVARLEECCPRLKVLISGFDRKRKRVEVWDFESDGMVLDYLE